MIGIHRGCVSLAVAEGSLSGSERLLEGKRGVIMGVANANSIAWHIARHLSAQGALISLSYQGEALLRRVSPLAEKIGAVAVEPCDVNSDADVDLFFRRVGGEGLDFLVHAIAYAEQADLQGRYVDLGRRGFLTAMEASVYSLTRVIQAAEPFLNRGASVITLSYLGGPRVVGSYGVMGVAKAALESSVRYLAVDMGERGVRVNALSAGPMRTLAARVIGDASDIFKWQADNAPLERAINGDDVGSAAVYLLSDWSAGTTGCVHYVDAGYHSVAGLKA